MFGHWQPKATPLSNLASVCYVLTAGEIFEHTRDTAWLKERLGVDRVGRQVAARAEDAGQRADPRFGFLHGTPPRYGWDGVSQCYVVHTFRQLAKMLGARRRGRPEAGRAKPMRWRRAS